MSWETRARGGRYYTRSRREGGRVVREYVGTGPHAELIAELDHRERDRRDGERTAWVATLADLRAAEAPVLALHDDVELLVRGALLAAGCHRHRGEWRRRRA